MGRGSYVKRWKGFNFLLPPAFSGFFILCIPPNYFRYWPDSTIRSLLFIVLFPGNFFFWFVIAGYYRH